MAQIGRLLPQSVSPISHRTVALLGDESGSQFLSPGGKTCALSMCELPGSLPPSPTPIPDLPLRLWDGSWDFSPHISPAPTFQWLQNTTLARGMAGPGRLGEQ